MRSLTLKLKLQISFALMVIITVIIGITSYFSLNNIQGDLDEIFEVRLPALDFLLEADRDLQQLLVAERSMIFTSPQDELFGRLIKDYEANREQAETRFNKYKQLASTDFERDYINQFDQAFSDWKPVSQSVVSDRQTNTDESNKRAMKLTLGESNNRFEKMRDNINKLQEYSLKSAEKAHNQAMQTYKTTIAIMIGLVVFGIVVGAFLGFFLNRQISKPLDHFNNVIGEVSTVIKSSSKMLNDISTDLASGMAQQAASVEETSASLVELKEMVQSNVNNAEHSSGQSKRVKEISETGHQSMDDLQVSIEKIQQSNAEIEELVTVIANIGEKTKIMDEIVFQTKLLSFNASVEAERAGEHGRGFAVVAQEVGNLASLSGKAALEIADIVGRSISKAENITKGNKEKVESGARAVQSAEKIFVEVKGSADEVAESSSQVLQASQEQAKGVDQINEAIQQIDQLTQKNTHLAEETSMGSQKLNDQIDVLEKITVDIDHLVNGY